MVEKHELRIPLPKRFVLRALVLYGIGATLFLLGLSLLLRAFALREFTSRIAALVLVAATPRR
jgi:hypothetical protein